jgi:hypothetical protein
MVIPLLKRSTIDNPRLLVLDDADEPSHPIRWLAFILTYSNPQSFIESNLLIHLPQPLLQPLQIRTRQMPATANKRSYARGL